MLHGLILRAGSYWIGDFDVHVRNSEVLREMVAERRDPIALSGVVPRREQMNTPLARRMHAVLGNFSGDECVAPGRGGRRAPFLRGAGPPADFPYELHTASDDERCA